MEKHSTLELLGLIQKVEDFQPFSIAGSKYHQVKQNMFSSMLMTHMCPLMFKKTIHVTFQYLPCLILQTFKAILKFQKIITYIFE